MHRPICEIVRVHEEFDQTTHHHRVARLADPASEAMLSVPLLYDAIFVYADTELMTRSGFERLAEGLD